MGTKTDTGLKIVTVAACSEDRPRSDSASTIELDDGRLLIAYHGYLGGPQAGEDFGHAVIFIRESRDGGLSWGDERMVVDNQIGDHNVMQPSLFKISGELLMGYARHHGPENSSMEILRSTDDGASFGEPDFVWSRCGERRASTFNCFVPLKDGRVLMPVQCGTEIFKPNDHWRVTCYISEDRCRTWQRQAGVIDLPMRGAMEPSVAQLDDGELICSLRTQLGSVFIARSDDCGHSWNTPQPSGLTAPEACTSLAMLPGTQRLVLFWNGASYVYPHHHFGPRTPLSVAVSDDRGHTWRRLGDIETEPRHEFTNLSCTFLRDGRAALSYMSGPETPDGNFNRTRLELRCALISRAFLES